MRCTLKFTQTNMKRSSQSSDRSLELESSTQQVEMQRSDFNQTQATTPRHPSSVLLCSPITGTGIHYFISFPSLWLQQLCSDLTMNWRFPKDSTSFQTLSLHCSNIQSFWSKMTRRNKNELKQSNYQQLTW